MTTQTFDADVLEMAPRLRAFLRRRVRDDATADDLTQETLLQQKMLDMVSGYQRYWVQMFDLQHFPPPSFPLQFGRPLTPDGQQVLISNRRR